LDLTDGQPFDAMPTTLPTPLDGSRDLPWGSLPSRMRILYVAAPAHPGEWLVESFEADSASDIVVDQALGAAQGITRLRDECYDAVIVYHHPGQLDALTFVEGLRAGGSEDAIIILGESREEEMAALGFEVGADGYACAPKTATRTLIWLIARAIERHCLIEENRRLTLAEQYRLRFEQNEADRAVAAQRSVIRDLEAIQGAGCPLEPPTNAQHTKTATTADRRPRLPLPEVLVDHYRELLRAYVIMGAGNLSEEMNALADLLASANVSAQQTLELHLHALEELLDGLGSRSSRHVMTRADLLVLEVMVHLTEGYRGRYHERRHPACQRLLPGFAVGEAA